MATADLERVGLVPAVVPPTRARAEFQMRAPIVPIPFPAEWWRSSTVDPQTRAASTIAAEGLRSR